jgi:hypothetical protein
MIFERVLEILNKFETKAVQDIELDRKIRADPYESIGRYKLIQLIKKQIRKEFKI